MKITIEKLSQTAVASAGTDDLFILGAPNSGKTALFNRLTGLHHKVGNYPGITVEKKSGLLRGRNQVLHDLPGAYNLNGESVDERVVAEEAARWLEPRHRPKGVLLVLDAVHLARSLYLALQVAELGLPTIIVLNFIDEARQKNIAIDSDRLRKLLGVYAVVPTSAKSGEGLAELFNAIDALPLKAAERPQMSLDADLDHALQPLTAVLKQAELPRALAFRMLTNEKWRHILECRLGTDVNQRIFETRARLRRAEISAQAAESAVRHKWINEIVNQVTEQSPLEQQSLSEKADRFLLHPLWGGLSMLIIFAFIFTAIFTWAQAPMAWIETAVAWLADHTTTLFPPGPVRDLLTDGVISGVGNVVVFLPQIMLLIFFLGILEDSGYMSRIAFFLDRSFRRIGLNGKAVLPMLSGFACAIPAVMASRTIENRRDRIITIMLIPLVSCSARLPVYTLLIAAFVPARMLFGFLPLQTVVMFGAYLLGAITALLVSALINKQSRRKSNAAFIMELPPYRLPLVRSLFFKVYDATKLFLINAGSIILALSIVIWFLASYPKIDQAAPPVEQSFAGQVGHVIEPLIKPLGFDWKIGLGLVLSFAAREVLVSSFATIYNVEEENNVSLVDALKNDRQRDGSPTYPPLVGASLLIFFVYAAQCMSTFAIIKRETNSWRWPLLMVAYMNLLAYGAALLVYQGGKLLGWG